MQRHTDLNDFRCGKCGSTTAEEYCEDEESPGGTGLICNNCTMAFLLNFCATEGTSDGDGDSETDESADVAPPPPPAAAAAATIPADKHSVEEHTTLPEAVESLRDEGVYFKEMLHICASCCKGPAQPGLRQKYTLSAGEKLSKCSACKSIYFCSKECQKSAWKLHKNACNAFAKDHKIACVLMTNPSNCKEVYLDASDPRFDQAVPSPVLNKCGIPLALLPVRPGENNQWCTFLLIDPSTGFAPMQYQSLGEVLLCRKDRMPITPIHVYQLGDFISGILDYYGGDDSPAAIAKRFMNREYFINFLTEHKDGNYFNPLGAAW
jgi:hypothetical protein